MCLICRVGFLEDDGIDLPCKHVFHLDCVISLKMHSSVNMCPACRAPLPHIREFKYLEAIKKCLFIESLFKARTSIAFAGNASASYKDLDSRETLLLQDSLSSMTIAAQMHHVEAQYELGHFFHVGQMVELNLKEAARWYEKAATQGHRISQRTLGLLFTDGRIDCNEPMVHAVKWLSLASKQGCSQSQSLLGNILRTGRRGVPVDTEEALHWLRASAGSNNAGAICEIGISCYEGDIFNGDLGIAATHFRRASEMGDVRGALCLSECHRRGHGVKQDEEQAQHYEERAASLAKEEEYNFLRNAVREYFVEVASRLHFTKNN
jgi:TPR repeat protein